MPILDQLISLIAPFECVECKREGSLLCARCAAELPVVAACCYGCGVAQRGWRTCLTCRRRGLNEVMIVTPYEGAAKEVLHRLKFGRARAAAKDVGRVMAARANATELAWTLNIHPLIVPVPTATNRIRARGYDQAVLLAREFAIATDKPSACLLARNGTQRQLGASGEVRRQQMKGAFRVVRPYMVAGQDVVLIDDVLTTGSTLESAAMTLRAAGARRVSAVVFARA